MRNIYALARPAVTVSAVAFLTLALACSKPVETAQTGASAAATQAGVGHQTTSKLGDLSAFRSITADVANMVEQGQLPTAKLRIKDLELAWDGAEAGLKPRAAVDWHVLDRAIDHALSSLRADKPSQADCKIALADLLNTLDTLQGKK